MFNVGNRNVVVELERLNSSVTATETNGSIKFEGTGVIKLKLYSDCTCDECDLELTLEIVDATNATTATSATSSNVVLLNDVGFSSLTVSGGYTLYGNGFKMTCSSDSYAVDRVYAFVDLKGGTLDNVQIIVPNFSHAIMYDKNKTEGGNPSNTDSNGKTRYYNIRSAVLVSADSKISNSYISGGRAAIYATSGTLTIENSTIIGGAVANIQAEASSKLALKNITLIQKPIQATVHDTSKTLMGLSILLMCDTSGNGAKVIMDGYFHQYAWANSEYSKYVPSDAQDVVSEVLSKTDYVHKIIYEDGVTRDSVNLGIAYMPDGTTKTNADNLEDIRSSNEKEQYKYEKITVKVVATIYTYKNTNGTGTAVQTEPKYTPTKQGVVAPQINYTETNDNRVLTTTYDASLGKWKTTLKVDVDAGVYNFSFAKLLAQMYGTNLSYTVTTDDGTVVDKNALITLNSAVSNVYILTITNNQIYDKNGNLTGETVVEEYRFELLATKTSLPAPTWTSTTLNGTPYIVVDSKGGDWNCAVPVLDGLKIKYWSKKQGKEVELNLADVVSAAGLSSGLQNGSNNTITITVADEYTLQITTTGFKTNDNGKPVVVNGKLYFTVSSSSNYVSTSTTSRTPNISYVFTDANNSDPINLSTSFNVVYATYKGTQYKYSDFCNGKLTTASSCVTADTLVTLADGTQKRIDEVTSNDMLLVWDFENGEYTVVSASIICNHGYDLNKVIKLTFEDGTTVKVVNVHGFFDADLNKWVDINAENAQSYVGHSFTKVDGDSYKAVKLVSVEISEEYVEAWSILTAYYYNCVLEGMFTITPPATEQLAFFEIGAGMKYDADAKKADIEKYGLYTYDEFAEFMTYEVFEALNMAEMKVAVGKGIITYEEILWLIGAYITK